MNSPSQQSERAMPSVLERLKGPAIFMAGGAAMFAFQELSGPSVSQATSLDDSLHPPVVSGFSRATSEVVESDVLTVPPFDTVQNRTPVLEESSLTVESSQELSLEELSCDDPRFREEFNRRAMEYLEWLEKAVECGVDVAGTVSYPHRPQFEVTVGDRIRAALESEDSEVIADVFNAQVFEVRSQLEAFLRDKVSVVGLPPAEEALDSSFWGTPGPPEVGFGTFHKKADEGGGLYFYEVINGQLAVWRIPSEWPEVGMIHALISAEKAAWTLEEMEL
ncbi:MAG: hypothetical protein KDD55_11465 [Bdellovibrionales bacterium]|nr:hypothetical protein [Bdellovibrionales bacterium]